MGAVVAGVDGTRHGWLAAELPRIGPVQFHWEADLAGLVASLPEAAVIAIDIPIGLPLEGYRRADLAARAFLGSRSSSLFLVPPESVLRAATYADARAIWTDRMWKGTSRQAFALREKLFEAALVSSEDGRVLEVHPEVSFQLMHGRPLANSKHSWDGLMERLSVLRDRGIEVALEPIGLVDAKADDVLDAVAAAWSARRMAVGAHVTFPPDPKPDEPVISG